MKNIKVIVENALRSVFEFEKQDMTKAKMLVEFKDILTQKEKNMIAYVMNRFGVNKDTIIEQNSADSLNDLNVRQVLKCMSKFKDHVTKSEHINTFESIVNKLNGLKTLQEEDVPQVSIVDNLGKQYSGTPVQNTNPTTQKDSVTIVDKTGKQYTGKLVTAPEQTNQLNSSVPKKATTPSYNTAQNNSVSTITQGMKQDGFVIKEAFLTQYNNATINVKEDWSFDDVVKIAADTNSYYSTACKNFLQQLQFGMIADKVVSTLRALSHLQGVDLNGMRNELLNYMNDDAPKIFSAVADNNIITITGYIKVNGTPTIEVGIILKYAANGTLRSMDFPVSTSDKKSNKKNNEKGIRTDVKEKTKKEAQTLEAMQEFDKNNFLTPFNKTIKEGVKKSVEKVLQEGFKEKRATAVENVRKNDKVKYSGKVWAVDDCSYDKKNKKYSFVLVTKSGDETLIEKSSGDKLIVVGQTSVYDK